MSNVSIYTIILKAIAKPFYQKNAGWLTFLFAMMVLFVGHVDGFGLRHYHYSLIIGILTNQTMLILLMTLWILYIRRTQQFINDVILDKKYTWFRSISILSWIRFSSSILFLETILLFPILLYAAIIIGVGRYAGLKTQTLLFITTIAILLTIYYFILYKSLKKPQPVEFTELKSVRFAGTTALRNLLLKFIIYKKKGLTLITKVFSCGLLLGLISHTSYDILELGMVKLFFNFSVFANGALILDFRKFEEKELSIYRILPITLKSRYSHLVYRSLILFSPEIATIVIMCLTGFSVKQSLSLLLSGLCINTLIFALQYAKPLERAEYLKIITALFGLSFITILTNTYDYSTVLFGLGSWILFSKFYYKYSWET